MCKAACDEKYITRAYIKMQIAFWEIWADWSVYAQNVAQEEWVEHIIIPYLSYQCGRVCLFVWSLYKPAYIAARCAAKCTMPAEGRMGRVLRGPACDYLPCDRRTCEVFLSRGTETPYLIDVMRSLSAGRNALKRSKTLPLREALGPCS